MSIAPTQSSTATSLYTTGTASTDAKKELDKEVFLALLVAQLRNQDPTAPMDTSAMMAQSTQLASMEQLTGLADTSREQFGLQMRMAASNLIGQEVTFVDQDGVKQSGRVTGAAFDGAVPTVNVGEWTVPLDAVSSINPATIAAPPTTTAPPTDDSTDDPTSSADPAA
ncbi:flagellar hook assembly protein FlgD [Actinotalea sp. K2]|uniref:flagellar hook assembly protein FlgD n=1 Tax=Actinotalea sp. K2 TaxID=2939438 RepID=UPI002017E1B7|nr:flagellar hook capping FlgD N-terminal domain-containing protein [Actinotalea sp. K2]MCL3860862.1 flagellar hook capping protein [Actinotalea sp. K2]